jgi:hypothetical protein
MFKVKVKEGQEDRRKEKDLKERKKNGRREGNSFQEINK